MSPVDTRLLNVLDALYVERSVTGAGRRLGLSQSAVSHALNRLRDQLRDDLFVRTPTGMQPTPLAAEICPRVHEALVTLQGAVHPVEFDPKHSTREFRLICTDYIIQVLVPRMTAKFMREAPSASIQCFTPSNILEEELSDGSVDVVLGIRRPHPSWVESELVLQDRWVKAVRCDVMSNAGDAAELAGLPHISLTLGPRVTSSAGSLECPEKQHDDRRARTKEAGYRSFNLPRPLRNSAALVQVAEPTWALWMIEHTDTVAIVPERMVHGSTFAKPIEVFDFEEAGNVDIMMFWLKSNHEPALAWLRGLIRETAAELS